MPTPPSGPAQGPVKLKLWHKFAGGFILICVVAAIVGAATGTNSQQASGGGQPSSDTEYRAFVGCQQFLNGYLKAPSTTKYRDFYGSQAPSVVASGDTYVVDSTVDSQNGFGAELRDSFSCTVQSSGGDWVLKSLSLTDPDGHTQQLVGS